MTASPDEPETPWHEPGQSFHADWLRNGTLRYTAEGREIVGHNGTCFNNRPLYCNQSSEGVVLAGDRPLVRLIAKPYVHGAFAVAIARQGKGIWLHEYRQVETRYHCGQMTWRCSDPTLPGVNVTLDAVPLREVAGFALRLLATGLRPGDKLIWAFGGAQHDEDPRTNWDPIMRGNPDICRTGDPRKPLLKQAMVAEWCRSNVASVEGQTFRLSASADAKRIAVGRSDHPAKLSVADASDSADPVVLAASTPGSLPMICGVSDLRGGEDEVFWAVEAADTRSVTSILRSANPSKAFSDAIDYLKDIERVQIQTPEPKLDAAVAAVCHTIDANYERDSSIFRHGCMAFNIRFIGWRVICGATALGWHDRVKGSAAHYFALQKRADEMRPRPQPDSQRLLCHEGPDSRFYGRGSIARDLYTMYDVQSQLFDQTISDWRWTADPELERLLRPALELHLEWMKDCFDPDDDGLYESYINTLPTDSVWYNGGGSAEESAYAYSAHLAARDMARRAGDPAAAAHHQARAGKIQRAMREVLWLKHRGHFGAYVEQGGHRRVHSDAWTLSQFLPIDAGMTTLEEALQALYYTEWALERIRLPFGGVVCQPSNWVPWKWSVRDVFAGDLFHLALACFQTGLGDEGWQLLLGATLESAYAGAVPGGFSHIGAGTDFSDTNHMFARAVVEGLFGFSPDYPNRLIRIRPAFPPAWSNASIRTPDFTLAYRQDAEADRYQLTLTKPADVSFRLPVCAEQVRRVTLDGQEIPWQAEAGFGRTWLMLRTPPLTSAELAIELAGRVPLSQPVAIEGRVGDEVCLPADRGKVVSYRDLHEVLLESRADDTAIRGRLTRKPGHHLVLAECRCGELPRWQVFKLHITDPHADLERAAKTPREASRETAWECLDLAPHYNADVRTIFQRQYLSPRPQTCSVRLGVDGYSAWTFPYWNLHPPEIDLCHVPELDDGHGRIMTPQRVPFARFEEAKNITFTSLWDNWPRSISIPVGRAADTIWLLVCGSTFPMQTRIANAEFRFRYTDGQVERLELVPPFNFWMLCPWGGEDYNYELDAFCLPGQPPPQVQLGNNCRAMVLSWKLRDNVPLETVTLETLSEDVVIGLMGVSLDLPADGRSNKSW